MYRRLSGCAGFYAKWIGKGTTPSVILNIAPTECFLQLLTREVSVSAPLQFLKTSPDVKHVHPFRITWKDLKTWEKCYVLVRFLSFFFSTTISLKFLITAPELDNETSKDLRQERKQKQESWVKHDIKTKK